MLITLFIFYGFTPKANAACQWIITETCSPDPDPKGAGCELLAGCWCGDPYYSTSKEVRMRCRSWCLEPGKPCSPDCPYVLYDRIEKWSCECIGDETQSCYTGPPGTGDVGICRYGVQRCSNGQWGTCWSEVWPQTEKCDGLDNNCDGTTDEGCDCIDNNTKPCYEGPEGTGGVGECRAGTQRCTDGRWGACEGQVLPQPEICDKLDNNCNNEKDDGTDQCCKDPCACMCCDGRDHTGGD